MMVQIMMVQIIEYRGLERHRSKILLLYAVTRSLQSARAYAEHVNYFRSTKQGGC
jgi:hypothetical protein